MIEESTLGINLFSVINSDPPTSTDYRIAAYILENLDHMEAPSIAALAEQCTVSIASVSRFCKRIQLQDFFELKMQILSFKNNDSVKYPYHCDNALSQPRLAYLDEMIVNLQHIRANLDNTFLDEVAQDLWSGHQITAMGHMQSGETALKLQHDLFCAGHIIRVVTRNYEQIEYFSQPHPNESVLVFSVSGHFFRNLYGRIPVFKKEKLPKIYLITANSDGAMYPFVYKVYNCDTGVSLAAGNNSLNTVADMIALGYWFTKTQQ